MEAVSESVTFVFLFLALYFEVFFLITYFESKEKERRYMAPKIPAKLPTVSVIVPVWNEENTVLKTVFSLLKLNYPKDKLSIYIIDDGSIDNTWKIIQRFAKNKQVRLFRKENGGKHTALNFALQYIDSDLVGCLDADSFVHPEALKRIVAEFEDKEIMAVTPSIKIHDPRGLLGLMQKAEYIFGIFLRKVFAQLNAIYITPGPLSIFRRSVFNKIGNYRKAYNTEDMEMGIRMQKNRMKIGNVRNAFVYTMAPTSLRALYKQRLRWVHGFIKNAIDYREMFFKPQYGSLGLVVLPAAGFSVISTVFLFFSTVIGKINSLILKIKEISTVGLHWDGFHFDFFFLDLNSTLFISAIAISATIFIIMTSRELAEEKGRFGLDSALFMLLYTMIAPFWISKAIYNVIFVKETKWR